jgi:predicted dehydrogenase
MDKTVKNGAASASVKPRLGFLGLGWIGCNRLESIAKSNLVKVAALADLNPESRLQAQRIAPEAQQCASLAELLRIPLDGLVIATPSAQHAEQACQALAAGIPVFCQKPLALNAASTRNVIACARRNDRLLGVDLSYRYLAGIETIRTLIAQGAIGKVFAADLVFHNAYGPDKAWYHDAGAAGGGCVMDLGIHLVDLLLWILDYPRTVQVSSQLYANGQSLDSTAMVENFAAAQILLHGGITARLTCSWHLHAGRDAEIRVVFYGTRGGLCLRNINGSFYQFQAERYTRTTREIIAPPSEDWWGAAAVDWAAELCRSKRYDARIEGLIAVAEVLDAIYAADPAAAFLYKAPSGREATDHLSRPEWQRI